FTESASCGGLASSGASALASGVVATLDSAANLMPVLVFPAGSGVIDRGGRQLACTLSDARDTERPIDGDGDGDPECDIGAFEHAASPLIFRNGFETAP
ncbi:MAG: choice-of-anchor Q domain-containing protein, partial [Aquimonas sp.]